MNCACEICAELEGAPSRFSAIYGDVLSTRIVKASDNFFVLPTIGQLGDAHLMIVSRDHETAIASLRSSLRQELSALLDDVKSWMRVTIGSHIFVFENGDPRGHGLMACSISHLHLHVVALRRPAPRIRAAVNRLGAKPVPSVDAITDIHDAYSLVQFGPQEEMLLVSTRLPSQTLRKIIAFEIGDPNWDWREAMIIEPRLIELTQTARSQLAVPDGSWTV